MTGPAPRPLAASPWCARLVAARCPLRPAGAATAGPRTVRARAGRQSPQPRPTPRRPSAAPAPTRRRPSSTSTPALLARPARGRRRHRRRRGPDDRGPDRRRPGLADVAALAVGRRDRPRSTPAPTTSRSSASSGSATGVFDEPSSAHWRDTYDEAACAPAGGVTGHAQATIDGRTVFIGTCAGGALTYHVRLEERSGSSCSITAVGERQLRRTASWRGLRRAGSSIGSHDPSGPSARGPSAPRAAPS